LQRFCHIIPYPEISAQRIDKYERLSLVGICPTIVYGDAVTVYQIH
jgi:hypothetical protein